MDDAFYVPDGAGFAATEHTRGPWSLQHQHAGPPAALMARALEQLLAGSGMRLVRITVDLLSPVPIASLEVAASVVRAGRKVQRLEATVAAGGRPVCRASALAIRVAEVPLPPRPEAPLAPPPPPDVSEPIRLPFFVDAVGYHTAVETRVARGRWGHGPAAVWLRPRVVLVAGEALTPLQRVMVAADSGNGVAISLDPARFTFVNADLTVTIEREPEGDWVCLDAATRSHSNGSGLTETLLWDGRGVVGRGLQTLVIEPRA
jgi:acyl-Coa thioesterase superfamily protein/acyl-CoA thioesterase superfamily protein